MSLIMCKQFGSGAATEFLKFLCQLTCDAQLAVRHDAAASLKCFEKPIRRFKKKRRLPAFSCCPQFALASSAFHRKKSTEREFLRRESGTEQSHENGRRTGNNCKRQFASDAFANEANPGVRQGGCSGVCDQSNIFALGEAIDQLSRTRRFIMLVIADEGLFDPEMF